MWHEWALMHGVVPKYSNELLRYKEAEMRLKRLSHSGAKLTVKYVAVNAGCLLPFDFVPIPLMDTVFALRSHVRKAINQKHGAPEVVFTVLSETPIDPYCHWLRVASVIWGAVMQTEHGRDMEPYIPLTKRHSRLSLLRKHVTALGWKLTKHALDFPNGRRFVWTRPEPLNKLSACQFRLAKYSALAIRRPAVYGGLTDIDVKKHKAFIETLDAHSAGTVMRMWLGCATTRAHRRVIDCTVSAKCDCGAAHQDLGHLVYECPLQPKIPLFHTSWSHLCPAASVAFLCCADLTCEQKRLWPHACRRAIHVLTHSVRKEPDIDWRGRVACMSISSEYAYCARCHVIRKAVDYRHIASTECTEREGTIRMDGDYERVGTRCPNPIPFVEKGRTTLVLLVCALCKAILVKGFSFQEGMCTHPMIVFALAF